MESFTLEVAANTKMLMISYVGMETKEISIGNRSNIPVTLKATDARLG